MTASTDRAADIEVTWNASANATGYRVYRCDVTDCSSDASWSELTTSPIVQRTFADGTAVAPGVPGAPTGVSATSTRTDRVDVGWFAVSAPLAPRYPYGVTTIGAAGESSASATAEGARAERPVTGYKVQIDGGAWTPVPGGLVTSWSDSAAAQATLTAGTATASQGTYPNYVRLSVDGASVSPGPTRTYRVRTVTAYGPAAASAQVSGWRISGALTYRGTLCGRERRAFSPRSSARRARRSTTRAPSDGSTRAGIVWSLALPEPQTC